MQQVAARPPRAASAHVSPDGPIDARRAEMTLLTAEQVAERLGVGVKWVWAQARAGRIPHVKLGRYKRFRSEAIDAWLARLEEGGEN